VSYSRSNADPCYPTTAERLPAIAGP